MVKSRESKRGPLSPLRAVARWFTAPRRNPHAEEDRANAARRAKRKKTGAAAQIKASKATTTEARSDELGYVDKSGNVRLTDGGRIVAKASKSSKAAALHEARLLFDQRVAVLDGLEAKVTLADTDFAALEQEVSALKSELRDAPGLGDVETLDNRFAALELALQDRAQEQWKAKRDIIARLEALTSAAPSTLPASISELSEEWRTSGSAGAVHDTVLERRFAAALETATKRQKLVEEHPDLLADMRAEVQEEMIELMADPSGPETPERLETLRKAWTQAGGGDDEAENRRFDDMAAAIGAELSAREEEAQSLRDTLTSRAQAVGAKLDELAGDLDALVRGKPVTEAQREVSAIDRAAGAANRDIVEPLQRKVADLNWRADREIEKRKTQVASIVGEAGHHLKKASTLPAKVSDMKEWRALEEGAKQGLEHAETALHRLKDLGQTVAGSEISNLNNGLREARKALGDARRQFFDSLDESRETNAYKKRALLDRLAKPSAGATAKELDAHVAAVMEDWKATGSAGRETDQALWEEFQDIRGSIRGLRDEEVAAEREDYGARLSEAFARKRRLTYTLEDEIRMGQLVLENQKDPKFEKELARKQKRLDGIRADLADIQKKLAKLSKPRQTDITTG